jgi:hypothetical protein
VLLGGALLAALYLLQLVYGLLPCAARRRAGAAAAGGAAEHADAPRLPRRLLSMLLGLAACAAGPAARAGERAAAVFFGPGEQ